MIKTLSLSENHRFRALYGKGKSRAGRYIVVYCMKNRRPVNRLGLTVSKKIGNAVTRNRIRRRMREAYRLNEAGFKSGFDIVIVARHGCGAGGRDARPVCRAQYVRRRDKWLSVCCCG